jgi:hypothetical protein
MSKRHHPIVDRVVDAFGNWLKRGRDIREMRELDGTSAREALHNTMRNTASMRQRSWN